MLFSPEVYEAIGTHAAVRAFSSTDVSLGYLAELQGWVPLFLKTQTGPFRGFSRLDTKRGEWELDGAWPHAGQPGIVAPYDRPLAFLGTSVVAMGEKPNRRTWRRTGDQYSSDSGQVDRYSTLSADVDTGRKRYAPTARGICIV